MSSYWTLVVAILAISPNNEILSVDVEKHHSLYTNFANCVIVGESHVQPVQEMMDDIILNELRVTGNKVMIKYGCYPTVTVSGKAKGWHLDGPEIKEFMEKYNPHLEWDNPRPWFMLQGEAQ